MAERKQLGAYWGEQALYFVETISAGPQRIFAVSLNEDAAEADTQLIADIQSAFRQHKINAESLNLSLPTKDILFRSFTIPWMMPSEIKSVVDFEATKYIPFALEQMSYAFHSTTFTERGNKRIRIIFVAIKHDVLKSYTSVFKAVNVHVDIVEPGPISLIRILGLQDLIPKDQTTAIVEKDDTGKIIVVDKGLPQFVREFRIKASSASDAGDETKDLRQSIISEIRISLDYFKRQENQVEVKQIMLLSAENLDELVNRIKENLGIPVTSINGESILGDRAFKESGFLKAYGVGLIDIAGSPAEFNLVKKSPKPVKLSRETLKRTINYKTIVKTVSVCVPLVILLFVLSIQLDKGMQKKASGLNMELSSFKNISTEKIQFQTTALSEKLDAYKKIRIDSTISHFLTIIPNLLPEGTWINNLDITYTDSIKTQMGRRNERSAAPKVADDGQPTPIMNFTGFAYLEDTKAQFALVIDVWRNFKENEGLADFFMNIDLEDSKIQKLGEYAATFFKIKCY